MRSFSTGSLNRRIFASAFAVALVLAPGLVFSPELAQVSVAAGLMAGAARFRLAQRGHGDFLRGFVSPNVAAQVQRRGPEAVLADRECEISIVCADVRNFTRFSSNTSPAGVMQFLREYYDAVGAAVAACGGTVKDYAGDGILVLLGAPQPMADHAGRAVDLARAIRAAALEVTSRWSRDELPLGIGVGVASGPVTVGVLGGAERLEYAAVGPAVNLASRLCAKAGCGEILVDERTRILARRAGDAATFETGRAMNVKGFDTPVASFAV